jgi:uncharacterized protein
MASSAERSRPPLLRGFTGFGFSLAAVPLLSLMMPPSVAVPVVVGALALSVVPSAVTRIVIATIIIAAVAMLVRLRPFRVGSQLRWSD